jgi:hypothetical protein
MTGDTEQHSRNLPTLAAGEGQKDMPEKSTA